MKSATGTLPGIALGLATAVGLPAAAGQYSAAQSGSASLHEWCGVREHTRDGVHGLSLAPMSDPPVQLANPDEMHVITILFFYTDGFADDFDRLGVSMDEQIRASVDLLNEALANSRVNAEVRVVGIERHPAMPVKQFRAMDWIQDDERAKRRRDELEADLVYALVDDRAGFLGLACEPDRFGAPESDESEGCFIGSINNFCGESGFSDCDEVWRTVLRHEVGHNLGIAHSPQAGGDPKRRVEVYTSDGRRRVVSGAVGYTNAEEDRGTVMGGNHWPVFSSSSYRYEGRVVGQPGVHEAARALRFTVDVVSNYRPRKPEPPPDPDPEPDYTDCEPTSAQIDFSHGYEVSACVEYEESGETLRMDAVDYGLDSEQSGLLYFFDRDNAEVLIKVLDACAVNGHRWVFVAPVTDLALNLEVREVATGKRWQYQNPRGGQTAKPRSDTAAFPCDATAASWAIASGDGSRDSRPSGGANLVAASVASQVAERQTVRVGVPAHSGDATDCEPDTSALTLRGGYTVSMCYETSEGDVGNAVDWGLDSEQSGLLYFFDRDNVEVLLKVLDGCGVNGHRWVFVAPVTDLAFNLIVESPDGQRWTHTNRLGQTADAKSDVAAFPCSSSA